MSINWQANYESAMKDWAAEHDPQGCERDFCASCVTLGAWDPGLLDEDPRTGVVKASKARAKAEGWNS